MMTESDNLKNKMIVLTISLILVGVVVLLFCLDNSLEWNIYKISSCIIVNLWVFFTIPALRISYLLNKDKSLGEWFIMGFKVGICGGFLSILLAPHFGIKYYFNL